LGNFTRQDIESKLQTACISFEIFEHDAVFTTADVSKLKAPIPGHDTKNLFLRDEKRTRYILVCVRAETRVDLKTLGKQLQIKGLTFCSAEDLLALLGIYPGSVALFALINDSQGLVQGYLDDSKPEDELIQNHPLENTATVVLSVRDLLRFAEGEMKHAIIRISVPTKTSA